MKVCERGNIKAKRKITKMLLDVVTFSWRIIWNNFEQHSVAIEDKANQCTLERDIKNYKERILNSLLS